MNKVEKALVALAVAGTVGFAFAFGFFAFTSFLDLKLYFVIYKCLDIYFILNFFLNSS
jgi:hypothetical protein